MATSYVMKISANGQISIPAATRARWHAGRVVVVDLGDHLALRPLPDDPVADLLGKYRAPVQARPPRRKDKASGKRRS
jgi:bifunctional DNA-binding transcriptional regulator/antitoxin component of YhaV-PrlF toxin-antitoxin module